MDNTSAELRAKILAVEVEKQKLQIDLLFSALLIAVGTDYTLDGENGDLQGFKTLEGLSAIYDAGIPYKIIKKIFPKEFVEHYKYRKEIVDEDNGGARGKVECVYRSDPL